MKKLFPIMFVLAACAADIPQDPAPSGDSIIVQFDPAALPNAIVPLPNDLAIMGGKIVVPPTKDAMGNVTDSPAQTEFNNDYLGQLDGFPYESTASVTVSGELDATTVTAKTVVAFDVTNPAAPTPVTIAPTYANKTITIPPPAGEWLRAHQYAIVVLPGLKGAKNEKVIGSQTWALVKSRNPLVTCPGDNLASPECLPAVDIIPSTKEDPAEKLAEQTKLAIQLETIRRGYDAVLKGVAAAPPAGLGVDRKDIPIMWTFKIVDAGEMTFDPANTVLPFPNDAARTGPKGTVALPHPKTGKPLTAADCQTTDTSILLVCGLNTLDGFSMLAPLISENSDKEGAISQAAANKDNLIDGKTLDPMSVGLVKLTPQVPAALQTTPNWTPCLNCASSPDATGKPQTSPQQLQWKLNAPLDEHTTYMGFVRNTVKDTKGKGVIANPVFALARSKNPLVDDKGKSTVSLITDDQAKQLEPLRKAFEPAYDGLEKAGGPKRADLALGFVFTTQSSSTILDQLYAAPTQAKALGLPDYPIAIQDATAPYKGAAGLATPPIDVTNIGTIYAGAWLTPFLLTGPGGTINPDATKTKLTTVQFAMAVPSTAPPAGGYPVTIFGHGINQDRNDFLFIANSLTAKGQVVIAADVTWHGERTSCTGAKAVIPMATDDAAACSQTVATVCDESLIGLCVLKDTASRLPCPSNSADPLGDGQCAAASQGKCSQVDHKCQGAGADLLRTPAPQSRPVVSGWNMFSLTNFFATRDNFRQQVVDLSQLVNVLKSTVPAKNLQARSVPLDTTQINYAGVSLGGILGTLFGSVSPDVNNVALNVPGGALVQIVLNAPAFASSKAALLSTLEGNGIKPGTPAFDQFLGIAQWVLDEADPAVMGWRLTHGITPASGKLSPGANRKVFIQFIEGDQTVPNVSNLALVAGANRTFDPTMPPGLGCKPPLFCYEFTEKGDSFDATSAPPAKRHTFWLHPPSGLAGDALTTKAQTQIATFISTGAPQ